jgi:hypothetical protein
MESLKRTSKEFKKENLPLDFLRRATSLGGLNSIPLKWEIDNFELIEQWHGVSKSYKGVTVSPWSDEHAELFNKERDGVRINNLTGFDTNIRIWENGRIQGYFKDSNGIQYSCDQVKWINLLLEYEFVEIIN